MNSDFENFADIMSNDVLCKLVGDHDNFNRFFANLPSDDIFVGNIAEKLNPEHDDYEFKKRYLTNSESVKFLLKELKDDIDVDIIFNVYYRVFPTYEEQKAHKINYYNSDNIALVPVWQKKEVTFNETLNDENKEIKLDFSKYLSQIYKDPNALLKIAWIPEESLESKERYDREIEKLKQASNNLNQNWWECELLLNKKSFNQNGPLKLVTISLINESEKDEKGLLNDKAKTLERYFEPNLFDVRFDIHLNQNEVIPFVYKYKYEEYNKEYSSKSRTINCHAEYCEDENKFKIKSHAKFKESKITPRMNFDDVDKYKDTDINISFETLSHPDGINELSKIHDLMLRHYNTCEKHSETKKEDDDYKEYCDSLYNFHRMERRFADGIQFLNEEPDVFRAFQLMNKTFFELNQNKKKLTGGKKGYDSWRLFQIVFIVSLIRDIVNKDYNKDVCELLHVMTGGGKSEAYFGLVIFSAFWDRISGRTYGVTAIVKFPLRMLSIQQLQRLAGLLIFAEKVRTEEGLDDDEFSMAYFVGNSNDFPRHNRDIIYKILKSKRGEIPTLDGQIIDKCPFCGGKVVLDADISKWIILHRCEECDKDFKIFFTDEEVYRRLPTVIVGTVDKFAGISQQRRVKNIYGGKLDRCTNRHGFIPHNDFCETKVYEGRELKKCPSTQNNNNPIVNEKNEGPVLIIQDEMHLIKEGFGAIDSHFETLIETMHEKFTGHKFKNIAMTATVTGATNQIKQLYNKKVCIFPPKLKDSDDIDFFFVDEKENNEPIIQREIIGLRPNTVYVRLIFYIIRYISEFIKYVEENKKKFCDDNKCFDEEKLNEILKYYKKILTYHNKKDDVQSIPFNAYAFINSKKYDKSYNIDSRTLTGENDLDYIKNTINLVENYYDETDAEYENRKDKLLTVSATSIVSHGVDIDDWNVMIFDGMSRSTSEYIQALSRVGRKKCGIVFMAFKTSRIRDSSFYQNFKEYHEILPHKVETVPLTRWPKLAFKQTITSVFTASVLNYMSNHLKTPLHNLDDFKIKFRDDENKELLIEFIKKVYLCTGESEIEKMIEEDVNERIDCLLESPNTNKKEFIINELSKYDDKYYKTQYGMRGIQDMVTFDVINENRGFLKRFRGE